jgi:hypothetical protein
MSAARSVLPASRPPKISGETMNWKTSLRAGDVGVEQRVELSCRKCGAVRYLEPAVILARRGGDQLSLGQVEARARCTQRGCKGMMRMMLVRNGEASGFVGGLA